MYVYINIYIYIYIYYIYIYVYIYKCMLTGVSFKVEIVTYESS